VPENVNKITIINGRLNNQIIANVQKCIFYKCQVINTIFKNKKDIYFKECTVENVSFSSADTICTNIDNLKQFHFSGPCNLYIYCSFEIIEFEHDIIINTYQIMN
jgi:hypothetical protein